MKKFACYILLAMVAAACIYPYEAELPSNTPKTLVVYGDIIIGGLTQIDLGYVQPLGKDMSDKDLSYPEGSVRIENDRGQYYLGMPAKKGHFTLNTTNAPEDARYRVIIKLKDGMEYTMPWTGVNQAPEITDLSYTHDNDFLRLNLSMDSRDTVRNFSLSYDEVWEYHADFKPDYLYVGGRSFEYGPKFESLYYCWNSSSSAEPVIFSTEDTAANKVEDNNFLTIGISDYRIMYLYSITVTLRGLTHEARTYLEHVRDFSTLTGDLFSPTPSEMRGNLTCVSNPDEPVLGYVSVCELATRQIYIDGTGIYRGRYDPDDLLFEPEPDESGVLDYDMLYKFYSPVKMATPQGPLLWGPKRCVDCRVWGGSKSKPDWWPNDDE